MTREVEDKYRNELPENNIHVFCASNTWYWDHRNTPMERALPLLELSGIIAIRRHCMSIVSASQLRMATKYLLGDIPNLLSRLHLWVQSRAGSPDAEKSKRTRDALNAMEHRLRRVRISLGSASRCFQKLLTPLKQDLHTAPINNLRKRLIEKFDRGINDCKGHVTSTATAATCNLTNVFISLSKTQTSGLLHGNRGQ